MTPAARLQAAIELLDAIIAATQSDGAAADTLIKRYFRDRRYAGSKDRRAVRELVYAAIRRYGTAPFNGRSAIVGLAQDRPELIEAFDGSRHGPSPLAANEIGTPPTSIAAWLRDAFSGSLNDADIRSLSGRAPLDIRVDLTRTSRESVVASLENAEPNMISGSAVRLPSGTPIEQHSLWRDGLIDIQDAGSQHIVDCCDAKPGMTIVDLCAGAGGKIMALHERAGGAGRFIACDIDRRRLSRLEPRAARSGKTDIETRLLNPGEESHQLADLSHEADLVVVDAPCTGSGTWRRNPETRWRLTEDRLAKYAKAQEQILEIAAPLVKAGGYLVYIVCSLLAREGEDQITRFLNSHSDFSKVCPATTRAIAAGDGYLLTPARHDTDGFFFARLQRSC